MGSRTGLDGCGNNIFLLFLENCGSDCGGGGVVCLTTLFNPLKPNDPYSGRTAPLTSKVAFYIFIQQI